MCVYGLHQMAASLLIEAEGGIIPGAAEGNESVSSNARIRSSQGLATGAQSSGDNLSSPSGPQRQLQDDGYSWSRGLGAYLDASTWPQIHGSRQSSDSTSFRGPLGSTAEGSHYTLYNSQEGVDDHGAGGPVLGNLMTSVLTGGGGQALGDKAPFAEFSSLINFEIGDANAVSVVSQRISDTTQLLWTSTVQNVIVFRQTKGKAALERLGTFDHGRNLRFHGSYAFCAASNGEVGFFTTMDDALTRYVLRGSDASGWAIQRTGSLPLPGKVEGKQGSNLVGITALADGTVVACAKSGDVMAARVNPSGEFVMRDVLRLSEHGVGKGKNIHISNSISSDGQQIFIMTAEELVRVDLNPDSHKLNVVWVTSYGNEEGWWVGRLGPGSGSTPTVTRCGDRSLVVITDGALPMQLLYYAADSGARVGGRRVQFGQDEDGWEPTTSEQSVAVDGCRAFVVQNYLGRDRLEDHIHCAAAPGDRVARRRLPDFCLSRSKSDEPWDKFSEKSCPPAFGCSAYGAAMFELQPQPGPDGLMPIRRLWTRPDVSCGTSIPLISTHQDSQVVYCAGLKFGSPQWSLVGLDSWSGADRTHLVFYDGNRARNFLSNPFFAGVESGGDDSIIVGSIGGVLHIAPGDSGRRRARRSLVWSNTTSEDHDHAGLTMAPEAESVQRQQDAVDQVANEVTAAMAVLGVFLVLTLVRIARRRAMQGV